MSASSSSHDSLEQPKRRDFMVLSAVAMGGVGAGAVVWPFIDSMNPSKDVLALASVDVNLDKIAVGQEIKVMWRGKPVFIRHRTEKEIEEAKADDTANLPDPQLDSDRVKKGHEQWLIMLGVCTHLGCVPLGNNSGDYDGWFCPCHGSHYDTSGRIRKGPAPYNLTVPEYVFKTDTSVTIG